MSECDEFKFVILRILLPTADILSDLLNIYLLNKNLRYADRVFVQLSLVFLLLPQLIKLLHWICSCGEKSSWIEILFLPFLIIWDGCTTLHHKRMYKHDYKFFEIFYRDFENV